MNDIVEGPEVLKRERELFRATLASIGDGVILTDAEGRITFLNAEAERLTGWRSQEAAGRLLPEVFRIINEQTRGEVESPVEKVLALGTIVGLANDTLLVQKNGTEIPIHDSAAPIRDPDGRLFGVVLVFRDFTAQKKANEARAWLSAIVEHSGDAVVTKNLDGIIQTWNESAEKLFGYKAAEIIGKPITLLIPPDRLGEEAHILGRLRQGLPAERFETERRRKDGRLIPISVSVSPIKDPMGRVIGASKVIHDISERKRAEEALRQAQAKLADHAANLEKAVAERTARLRETVNELQTLSYSLAHDMRAPLRAMSTFAEMLLEEAASTNLSAEGLDFCHRIRAGASRLDKLICDALAYSRAVLQESVLEAVDLDVLLRGLVASYPNLHADHAEIRIEGRLPVVLGNDSLLTQCFSNLLGNAVKFVEPGARPRVRVWSENLEGRARIWVEDQGIGIPKCALPRLFGMFQKLDNRYEGTGIGLAIVRKVVERMNGRVGVESEPGQGSRFWVELRTVGTGPAAE